MKIYSPNEQGWFCGYWNNSNLQIKYSKDRPLKEKALHAHNFAEYYLLLNGELTLEVEGKENKLKKLELMMVEPGENHKIISKSKNSEYIIIKEKSFSNNKI